MRKLKRILSLFLMAILFIGMSSSFNVQAQPINEVAPLEIKVNGEGTVIVDDGYSTYSLENKDTLKANVTVNTDLKLTVNPNDGYYIASVNGIDKQLKESAGRKMYSVTTKVEGTFIEVNFDKEIEQNKKEEIIEEHKEEVTEVEEKVVTKESIIAEYESGIYNSNESREFRKNLVEKYSLHDAVDGDYFFTTEYIDTLIDNGDLGERVTLVKLPENDIATKLLPSGEISPLLLEMINNSTTKAENSLLDILPNNTLLKSKMEATVRKARAATAFPTILVVSNDQDGVFYYEGGIVMGRTSFFTIGGVVAFCADHSLTTPTTGTAITSTYVETNSLVRKVLYYGFNGPAQVSGWDSTGLRVATAMAISEARNGDGMNLGKRLLNQVRNLPEPPSSFTAYIAVTGASYLQNLAFGIYSPKGQLQISKSSANPDITNGNNYYDITGAQYGVYKNSNATNQVGTLTIGSNGWSNVLDLDSGTYYIKETKAPKGYALDGNIYPITVNSGSKETKAFTDRPQTDPISIVLNKVDADTGNAVPVPGGTLADTHFTVKFYSGEYADGTNPSDLGISPIRTWILKTDDRGRCRFNDDYKVSGDAFWYNSHGVPTLPLGTLTIQETKAPIGYKINSQIFVRRITPNSSAEGVGTFNVPTIKEDSLNFVIKKVQRGTTTVIANAKFRHTKPNGTTEELTTGSNGEVIIRGLTQGTHRIVETQAPEGYEVNKNEFVFEVKSDNTIKVISNISNMGMSYAEDLGDGILTVSNDVSPYKLRLTKVNDKGAVLEGAEFTIYSDKDCNNAIETQISDGNGNLSFKNLKPGVKYYMKETKAPKGYRIPVDVLGRVHVYEIYAESTPVDNIFNYSIDSTNYTVNDTDTSQDIYLTGTKGEREINLKVVNIIGMKLPNTGSFVMIPILILGISLMSYSLMRINKKRV